MLETALNIPPATAAAPASNSTPESRRTTKFRAGTYGYILLTLSLVTGWLLSEKELVDPNVGLGYWLGIVGGVLMLLLLLYPSGKKSPVLRRLGLARHWFRIHMVMGLVGPLLILYHCNFTVGAMNSKVALYSMLGVAISGVVGRYFYARIHRGLYGKRAGIEELRHEISDSMQNNRGIAAILPEIMKDLQDVSTELLGDQFTRTISVRRSLEWTVKHHIIRARLYFRIRRDVQARAVVSETVRANQHKLRRAANAYVAQQVRLMRQVAQLSFYERLFSLWHVFHMPLFILLVVSALVHVLAVHMY